jgi:hypothetical protein
MTFSNFELLSACLDLIGRVLPIQSDPECCIMFFEHSLSGGLQPNKGKQA